MPLSLLWSKRKGKVSRVGLGTVKQKIVYYFTPRIHLFLLLHLTCLAYFISSRARSEGIMNKLTLRQNMRSLNSHSWAWVGNLRIPKPICFCWQVRKKAFLNFIHKRISRGFYSAETSARSAWWRHKTDGNCFPKIDLLFPARDHTEYGYWRAVSHFIYFDHGVVGSNSYNKNLNSLRKKERLKKRLGLRWLFTVLRWASCLSLKYVASLLL